MEPQLTEREQLIERMLRLPADQVTAVAEFVEALASDPIWSDEGISADELERRNQLDLAAIEATRGEETSPLEDVLNELGINP